VNRNLALALDDDGTFDVSIYCTEGPGDYTPEPVNLADKPRAKWFWDKSRMLSTKPDVVIRNLYPPRVHDVAGRVNFLYFFWEDSLISPEWAAEFNRSLDGMFVPSVHVQKALTDSGVKVPIHVLHAGVEERFFISPEAAVSRSVREKFNVLHVSSGFPRKGIDVLLEAFFKEFSPSDRVALTLKTFPNIHNDVAEQLEKWRSVTPSPPECLHINKDLNALELDELYAGADCMVYPTRGEGFGLPIAEAMAHKIPVIVTAYSGHMEFCSDENTFLVKYEMGPSGSHLAIPGAEWAEPDVQSLRQQMRSVVENRDSGLVRDRVNAAYNTISDRFRWSVIAQRCAEISRRELLKKSESRVRIGMVTSWDARCGIAEYSRYLIEALQANHDGVEIEVLNSPGEGIWGNLTVPSVTCWQQLPERDLKPLVQHILKRDFDVVHFQFNFGFFELLELGRTIRQLKDAGKKVLLTLHSTADVRQDGTRISLAQIANQLRMADALLVHSKQDQQRLSGFGIRENVGVIPHGSVLFPAESTSLRKDVGIPFQPLIGTFGFLLPHKGILELLEAIVQLRNEHAEVGLLAQCALHSDPISYKFEKQVRNRIEELHLSDRVLLSTEFIRPEEAALFLQLCDVLVLPYKHTTESASGAIRFALAAGRPVITTQASIFDDVDGTTYRIASNAPGEIAKALRALFSDPGLARTLSQRATEYSQATSWDRIARFYLGLVRSEYGANSWCCQSETFRPDFSNLGRSSAMPNLRLEHGTNMAADWQARAVDNPLYWIAMTENEDDFKRLGNEAIEKYIFNDVEVDSDATVLEIGCGIGRLLLPIGEKFHKLYGVDISPRMIELSKQYLSQFSHIHTSVNGGSDLAGFDNDSIDFCFSFVCFQHIPDRKPIEDYIREAFRALTPGGVFKFQIDGAVRKGRNRMQGETWVGVCYTPEEIATVCKQIGFSVLYITGAGSQYMWVMLQKPLRTKISGPIIPA
jgi:glycosyltransferase involved in cell wall biosynthesis/SAM-dependent methyltransferase